MQDVDSGDDLETTDLLSELYDIVKKKTLDIERVVDNLFEQLDDLEGG